MRDHDDPAGGSTALEARAIHARDQLRERANAVRSGNRTRNAPVTTSPCDGYFAAAVALFNMAAETGDPQLFIDLYQSAEAHLQLGRSCLEQVVGGRHND